MKIRLQGFRGLDPKGINVTLSDLTLLTGKNSSGKSTFLKVMELLSSINYINGSANQEIQVNTELLGGISSFVSERADNSISASFYFDTAFFGDDIYVHVQFHRNYDKLLVRTIELREVSSDQIMCYKYGSPNIIFAAFIPVYMKRAQKYNQLADYLFQHHDIISDEGWLLFCKHVKRDLDIEEAFTEYWATKILAKPSGYLFTPIDYVQPTHDDWKFFVGGQGKFFKAPEMAFKFLSFEDFKTNVTKEAEGYQFLIDEPEFLSCEFYRAIYALYLENIWEANPSFNRKKRVNTYTKQYGDYRNLLTEEDSIPYQFYSNIVKTEFTLSERKAAIELRSKIRIVDQLGNQVFIDDFLCRLGLGLKGVDKEFAEDTFEHIATMYFRTVQHYIEQLASYTANRHEARRSYNLFNDSGNITSFLKVLPSLSGKSVVNLVKWVNDKLATLDYPGELEVQWKSGVGFLYYRQGTIKTTLIDEGTGTAQFINMLMFLAMNYVPVVANDKFADPNWSEIFSRPLMKSNIVILEEPETSLHPSIQSRLADLLINLVKEGGKVIIVETHSEYLLRKLQFLVAKEEVHKDKVIINYFEKAVDEKHVITTYPIYIDENGHLSRQLGPGFLDEADRLSMDLFDLNQQKAN